MNIKTKIIIFLLFTLCVNFFSVPVTHAAIWWENFGAAGFKQVLETIMSQIMAMIRGMMKQMAVQMLTKQVNNMVSGGGTDGAMFIIDWRDAIVKEPAEKTDAYMNDFFSMTTGGISSASNYSSGTEGVLGNYSSYLQETAKQAISGDIPRYNLNEYVGDPADMLSTGNWQAWGAYFSNDANNPYGYRNIALREASAKYAEEEKLAMTKAIAYQGYKGKESGGQIVTPGSLVKDIQADTQDIGNKALANATSIPEIITSLVSRLVMQALQKGVGSIQKSVQKEIGNTRGNYQQNYSNSSTTSQYKSQY